MAGDLIRDVKEWVGYGATVVFSFFFWADGHNWTCSAMMGLQALPQAIITCAKITVSRNTEIFSSIPLCRGPRASDWNIPVCQLPRIRYQGANWGLVGTDSGADGPWC